MNTRQKKVGIAFQGGGFAGGAIATGAVTYLVEHGDFRKNRLHAFSGTSSGALVASLCWGHLLQDNIDALPRALKAQWTELAYGTVPDAQTAELLELADSVAELNPVYQTWSQTAVVPYLRQTYQDWVLRHINVDEFRRLRDARDADEIPKLRIGATDILHGRPKIFTEKDFSLDVLSATGSLDDLIGITDIKAGSKHEKFIDGAWATNPPLTTLLDCDVEELWLIEVFPRHWDAAPRTPMESKSRRDELWQCALIFQELYFIRKVNEWIKNKTFARGHKYRHITIRRMKQSQSDLLIGSIYVNDPSFMAKMMDFGYRNAATLFEREPPESSPFANCAQLETPLGLFARNANTVNQWYASSLGTRAGLTF